VFRTTEEARIWAVNLDGTRNLIAATQAISPQARFLLAGTSNVYGPELTHPGRETDATTATHAYPASKIQAEAELRASGLNWVILRFPFVYGDQDGHLEAAPQQLAEMGWHPARKLSVIHHEDIATAIDLALTGELDGQAVNIADDSPLTAYEMAQLVDSTYESSGEALPNPWQGHMDVSLARSLGFRRKVPPLTRPTATEESDPNQTGTAGSWTSRPARSGQRLSWDAIAARSMRDQTCAIRPPSNR
jgi:nucleoside-diphosphate-sugar epimerase